VIRRALLPAGATMVAVLGSLGTTMLLRELTTVPTQASVLAVVLSLMLGRSVERGVLLGAEAAIDLVVISLGAAGVAWLLVHERTVGQALLVLGLSIGPVTRRSEGLVGRAGRVVTQPFLALLVTPVPVVVGSTGGHSTRDLFVWSPLAALVALPWTSATARLQGIAAPAAVARVPRAPSRRRLDVPTRMALQMLVGVGAAMVVGRVLFDDRWAWCVLSAFVVASGNRGRGDVAHKAGLRLVGALLGTVVATVSVLHVPAGHRSTLVALFAVMAVALVLRQVSYAFWAAGMTAMLSLLHAYYGSFGQSGAEQLRERLLGVAIGSALGLASAWFVLPVRTGDVFRRRLADALRALTDDDGTFPAALTALDQLRPTLRAGARHHSATRRRLEALRALHALPEDEASRQALRGDVVRIRRAMVGKDAPRSEELAPVLRPVLEAVRR